MRRSWPLDLLLVVSISAAARIALFSGFVGGDDFAYAALAREILDNGYPMVGSNPFAGRPVLMLPIAASIAMLGWTEWAIVLPVFVGSLVCLVCTYALARVLAGRVAALAASLTLAVLPLDLVYATTTTNDILGSAVIAAAALLTVLAFAASDGGRHRASRAFALTGGVLAGLAVGVKVSMVMALVPFAVIVPLTVTVDWRRWKTALVLLAGFACGHLLLIAFFLRTSGAMFPNYETELGFSRAFMAQAYLDARVDALWAYPGWAFGFRPAAPDVDRFFPYGLFFPLSIVASGVVFAWAPRRVRFVILWFALVVVLVEFWPLQIVPYIPIHRLPRFLHLAAVPGAILIGIAYASAFRRRGVARRAAVALLAVYAVHGIATSVAAAVRHHDSMQDLRFAADVSARFPGAIVTDAEMRGYLLFRRGFRDQEQLRKLLGAQVIVPAQAMVIYGGGRRIDMDPDWSERRVPSRVPQQWIKLASLPGRPRPWRRSQGSVLVATTAAKLAARGFQTDIGSSSCGAASAWRLADVVDVGDAASEDAHDYRVDEQTFAGERMMYSAENGELEDDGRAFRKSQSFVVGDLQPGVVTCVVKRIDPGARRQVSSWSVDERAVATITADSPDVTRWLNVTVTIPAAAIASPRVRVVERFVSAAVDVNSYRIEVYQPAHDRSGQTVDP